MKKILVALFLCLMMVPTLAGADLYTAGVYEAVGQGLGGEVPVSVTFSDSAILSVEIGENAETAGIGTMAIEALPEAIIAAQSVEVDSVAGATVTSQAILEAVQSCINQAAGVEASAEIAFTAGTYTSNVRGMRGAFDVTVTFAEDRIEAIEVGENSETAMVGTEAIRILPERILANQSLDVDTLTGATVTSRALIMGIEDCVKQAGGSIEALRAVEAPVATYDDMTHEADILVIGGGIAGSTAAIAAYDNGANVILLEAREFLGGNSVLATGLFVLGGTEIQKGLGIEDTPDAYYEWVLEHGQGEKDPVQARWIADNGQKLIEFMTAHGYMYNTEKMNVTDGSDVTRTHLVSPSSGEAFQNLADYINEHIDVRYNTKATSLILDDDGAVIGVNATDYYGNETQYYGKKIVLACGGFADNPEMIGQYWGGDYASLVYGGAKGMDGTMLAAARDQVDAALETMDNLHIDATLEVTHGVTVTTTLMGSAGAILVRQSTGERFVDEAGNHSEDAAAAMHDLGDEYYWEIIDNTVFDVSETVAGRMQGYIDMGLMTKYETIPEMAAGMGVDEAALTKTIEEYNAVVRGEMEDPFGRDQNRFFAEMKGPFYVLKTANGVACTTGGLKIDGNMQVVNNSGETVPNLYAVGEITGGYLVHYVGGDSLARSSIGGMVLGERLATQGE